MFDEGSLFWIFSIVLKYHVFHIIYLMGTIGVAYALLHFVPNLSLPVRKFQLNKLFYAIIASQILILLISAAYISHQFHWLLMPDAAYSVKFISTSYHFIILSTGPGIGLLLSIFIIKVTFPLQWPDFGLRKPEVGRGIIIALVFIGIIIIIATAHVYIYFAGSSYKSSQLLSESLRSLEFNWRMSYMAWLVIVSPIIEEIFFRGIIFATLKEISGFKISLIFQAMLFALVHNEINELLPLFISGLVLAYVYYKSKSLLPSIIIHSLQNIWAIGMSIKL